MVVTTKFEISGITNSVMNYFRYMDKTDMNIDFLVPNLVPDRLRKEIENNGGKVFELLMRNRNPLKYMNKMESIVKNGNYDIVHAHGNSATLAVEMLAAKKAGTKIRISHSRNTTCKYLFIDKLLRPLFNRTYTQGFACGEEAGKWLFGNKKFTVITNGNDVERFTFNKNIRYEYRRAYNSEGKRVIGHIGSFNYQKNHEFLINIFYELLKINSECVLLLVGDGDLRPSIEDKVEKLGIRDKVVFAGKSLEVEKLVQAMDIMVFPSRYEGLPNVVVECQIACLPSLISDQITREVQITDLVEFLALEQGPKAWAQKINQMGQIEREDVKKDVINQITDAGFNIKENAKELKEIYKKLYKEN